jgi:hypothetical protein
MNKSFLESDHFLEWVKSNPPEWDETYRRFQLGLLANPDAGTVMKGCGGLRKARLADPKRGKGKRGGARIIYLHVPEADRIFLLDIYDKDEQDDLGPADRKVLTALATEYRDAAIAAVRETRGDVE